METSRRKNGRTGGGYLRWAATAAAKSKSRSYSGGDSWSLLAFARRRGASFLLCCSIHEPEPEASGQVSCLWRGEGERRGREDPDAGTETNVEAERGERRVMYTHRGQQAVVSRRGCGLSWVHGEGPVAFDEIYYEIMGERGASCCGLGTPYLELVAAAWCGSGRTESGCAWGACSMP